VENRSHSPPRRRREPRSGAAPGASRLTPLLARPGCNEQQELFERITIQCPEVINLRLIALRFRAALTAEESTQLRQWIEGAKRSEFGAVVRFAYPSQTYLKFSDQPHSALVL
jgi:hypothetical protein